MNTIYEIVKNIDGKILQFTDNYTIKELLIDSRLLLFPSKTIFFSIKTARNDGHLYIKELYDKNVRNFVITQENFPFQDFPEANFILVENAIKSLQKLAVYHRKTLNYPIIGITGSNGKTIVKEWCKQLLEPFFRLTASPKSYNSQIGVPLSIWQAKSDDEIAIFEAGVSQPNEMEIIEKIIQPTIGIFTNIGSAHEKNFSSITQKIQEKLKLFKQVNTLIYHLDNNVLNNEIQLFIKNKKIKLFTWGEQNESDIWIKEKSTINNETQINFVFQNQDYNIKIPFTDKASFENVMHCLSLTINLNISIEDIIPSIQKLKSVALRLEYHKGINKCIVINDSYNLDIDSLRIALDFLNQQVVYSKKSLILSDILQAGNDLESLYQSIATLIQEKEISRFIGIGNDLIKHKHLFPTNSLFFENTNSFLEKVKDLNFREEAILLKGARDFHFENINSFLQKLTHETILEVNLSALIHNLNYFKSQVPSSKIMAMVKAFAYGSGSAEVANVLQYHSVDYLCVAYIDEGVDLRKSGITLPIMIMNPEASGFEDIIKYNLEPEIYNFRTLKLLEDLVNHQLFYRDSVIKFHLKLDTGMHRLGFEEKDLDKLIYRILQLNNCKVQSVFSHFSCSDDDSCYIFSEKQLEKYQQMSQKIMQTLPYPILRHISNSAAIHSIPDAKFDMVRLGIGLYGVSSYAEEQKNLEVVNSLYSVISQIKEIEEGEFIGYSQGFKTSRKSLIATIPIGYADGLHRSLKNRGEVFINGHLCPIVGNICMDMCMADITDIEANEGDRVEIFGNNNPISRVAEKAQTIPYELFTGISPRVKRVYIQE